MTGWEKRPLRAYADVRLGRQRSPKYAEGPHMVSYLRAANVKDGELDLGDVKTMNFTPEEQAVFSLREGDVLVTEGSGSLTSVGASAVWCGELSGVVCFQNTLIRLRPRSDRTDGGFLGWWARHAFVDGLFASIANGANIYHVSAERVRDLHMGFPPLTELRAIADFLDAETSRIDALIAKKRRLSRLAHERLAVVTRRATTFERRSVPMRRVVEQVKTGTTPSREAAKLITDDGEVEWITPGDFDMLPKLSPSARRVAMEAVGERHVPLFPAGSVLVVGIGATAGKVAYAERAVSSNQQVTALVPGDLLHGRFLGWQLWSRKDELRETAPHTTLPILNNDFLRSLHVDLPDKEEQIRIANELDRQAESTSRLAFRLREQIALLTDRRQALITGAVTGELDVARSVAEEAS